MNENRKFDTKVQVLKYKVLREVARLAWEDKLLDGVMDIPGKIVLAICGVVILITAMFMMKYTKPIEYKK